LDAPGAGLDPVSFGWMRPLALAAVAVVVTAAFQSHPEPGLTGERLAVSVALLVIAAGTFAAIRLPRAAPTVEGPLLAVVVLAAAALVGLQPDGPGYLAVFPAVSAAALRLTTRAATMVAALAAIALVVAWTIGGGDRSVIGIVLNEFGVLAFFLLSLFGRRYREANDRAQQLIVELEETRAAQAEAAAIGERQRLAREMHDVLAHSLSGLVINLEGARLMAERADTDPRVVEAVGRAQRLAKTGLEEARRAIGMLRGESLPGPERLEALATEFELDTGIPCTFALVGPKRDLASDARLTVYRVAQEALTNIRKHAQPDRVELRLVFERAAIELTVEDHRSDGDPPPPGDGTGYGLTGMCERAELLDGRLVATPTPDGFVVTLWVPT
jgi:signal transduction histidine kinase